MNIHYLCNIFTTTVLFILGLFPVTSYSLIDVEFLVIVPYSRQYNKLPQKVTKESFLLGKNIRGIYDFRVVGKFLHNENPDEILKIFCEDIFPKKINTVMFLNINPDKGFSAGDYVMSLTQDLGYPFISWDPDLSLALQEAKNTHILQMAPTISHESNAMVNLLLRYNWTSFTIISTTSVQYLDFFNSIEVLVKEHNENGHITRLSRLQLLSKILIDTSSHDEAKMKVNMKRDLVNHNVKENRVFLLHSSSAEAKNLFDCATELGLTTKEYMWIISSSSIGNIVSRARRAAPSYPLGLLGFKHYGVDGQTLESVLDIALKTSIYVWGMALKNMAPYIKNYTITPKMSCNQSHLNFWNDGLALFRHMKNIRNVSFINKDIPPVRFNPIGLNQFIKLVIYNTQSKTTNLRTEKVWRQVGNWVPRQSGGRTEMDIEMNDITWPGDSKSPPKGKPDRRHFRIVTLKEEPYVKYRKLNSERKCGHHEVPCRLVYNPIQHGNDSTLANDTVLRCCAGLCVDLLKILSTEMKFDYDFYEVPDQTWGLPDQVTGEWNGLIREVKDRKADMVLTSLKITPARNAHIDFSIPFLETGITIIVSIRKGAISPTAFLEPYDYPSWCLILVFSVHATGASIFIYEWLSPSGLNRGRTSLRDHKFSLFRSFWLIWSMLFGASVSTDNPRGVASRFMTNVWALFALVFLASYTANLAAFMITKDEYYKLSGITDWRLRNPYSLKPPFKFATVPNGSTEENLRQNHKQMFTYMKTYNKPTVAEGIESLKAQKIDAFIYDATPLEYQVGIDKDCNLITVGERYAMTGYGVGVPKGSDLMAEINEIILELQENGELERLRKFWLAGACHRKQKRGQHSQNIGILNFTSAFILLAGGMLLGSLLLLLEHIYFKFGRSCLRRYDKSGCCALISLSMGKSLNFEQSVREALDIHRKHKCKNAVCELQIWKTKHELDLSLLQVQKLQDQLRAVSAVKVACRENHKLNGAPALSLNRHVQIHNDIENKVKEEHYPCSSNEAFKQRHIRHGSDESVKVQLTNIENPRWNRRSLKRSSSYTNAVMIDLPENSQSQIAKYDNGHYYVRLPTQNPDDSIT
ncbi:GRIN2B [Mytilus coruscus]|uniref:GRIN2B n=1 Tax=Mytilus coruscus TaxID=42192 RepID=A0A6J8B5D0_MYTCO|nr:GRIN2B [Mytilus coruscus]